MKLSAAINVLTVGTVGASIVTRQGRRRLAADGDAAAVAADNDATIPDSDQARRLWEEAGGYSIKCDEEEIGGIVHLSFTGGDKHVDYESVEEEDPISTGFGGFAFRFDSTRGQSVAFKSAAGSNFDFEACMEYTKEKTDAGCDYQRRMQEDADATIIYPDTAVNTDDDIEADNSGGSYCDGYDTVLYCPMKPGQCATFQLTDTIQFCTCESYGGVDMCPEDMSSGMSKKKTPGRIVLDITTPGDDLTSVSDPSTCSAQDAVAAFQCAPNSENDFIQTSGCLYGNEDGAGWDFILENCEINSFEE